ncbi:uncharacterized protein ANIA_11650 [Aspergillus nidulans FGSC A4]|uniref:Uncharacterized protein n=1 Tax=Emericella nidulans (strain FGSC A4 / ATCC 38163 / CBS 112.46 / NRRL 194 / M139) TaxID=227321 RepID=C8VQA6_EMENI|nr:hypothetical protein [Aspergillus nidulans FGSC A4]CBF87281.1 TPA: hypothetical protein ANIA_11650 [Aspergillus nidulans FGSC A4]
MAERDPSRVHSSQTPMGDAVPTDQFPVRRPSIGDEVTRSRSMSTGSEDSNNTSGSVSSPGPTQPGRHWLHWPRYSHSKQSAQRSRFENNDVIFLG